ncbi:class I adenylate-forming enzyme family protein [Aeromicrobium sp. CTD01-1L150]|uniref:class I adenylate-forming enzyme family protein n=1 Tax=Aeromicrobium sp. CTD01-1L150 TaxID=3341830 RepID=UPI0035C265C0
MTRHAEALAKVTAPGAPFELTSWHRPDRGVDHLFTHAPATLREIYNDAQAHGDATFLVHGSERHTFTDVIAAADAFAAALVSRYGVTKGDRVAIAMRNCPEWVVAFLGITSVGAICVSLNSWWTPDELAYAIEDAGPSVLVADEARADLLQDTLHTRGVPLVVARASVDRAHADRWEDVTPPAAAPDVDIRPDDDATLLYTSGTTGRSKGAVSTHRAVVHALWGVAAQEAVEATKLADAFPTTTGQSGALLAVPLFHVTGCVAVMLGALRGGQKLVIMPRWVPEEALRLIETERLTSFVGVPTQCFDLVNHPRLDDYDTSSLQWVGGGGSATPPALLTQLRQRLPATEPSFGYGMTETNALGPAICCDEALEFPDSVGWLAPSMRAEIRDPHTFEPRPTGERGELWVRGPSLIRGYWNRPEETAETFSDGWLRTGDIGHLDADGRIYIDDRLKDMVVRGGENVYCAEVEAAIYEHPDVLEAVVFGVPDERLGETVAAAVVTWPDRRLDRKSLLNFLATRLAAYKTPTTIELRTEALPRNPSGKFVKTSLKNPG